MKKIITISGTLMAMLYIFMLVSLGACKKSTNNDPNVLTGTTNLPLTQVDSQTTVYMTMNGISQPGHTTFTVLSNNNGMVTYGATVDLSSYPDSVLTILASILPAAINYYNPKDVTYSIGAGSKLNIQFTVMIASDGMQNYFVDGKPWTLKYGDPVGTNYSVTRNNGQTLTATVMENDGIDEWPFGFYLIKTSLIEYTAPADDPVINKVSFRVNHKFGLVYLKVEGKNGRILALNMYPYFMM